MPYRNTSPSGVLRQLLSRLQTRVNAPAAATLAFMMLTPAAHAADTPPDLTLPTVKVEGAADPMAVNNGYQATQTRVGKTLQDPQNIPQAITTITHQLMEDQQVSSLKEALRNVAGLTFNAAEGGRSGDNMMLRGFYTFGDLYLDGIRDTAQYNRETFNLEQVDVLRGSASMLFGRGQAGGVINLVSKTPKLTDAYTLTGSAGSYDYAEATADLNKRLGEHTAVRVNLMKRQEGSWRSNPVTGTEPELHRDGVAVSLAFGIETDDELTYSYQLTRTRDIPDYGVSFDNATRKPTANFPASYFWGVDANFDDSNTQVGTAIWTHRFAPDNELRTTVRLGDYKRSYWARTPSATVAPGSNGLNAGSTSTGVTRSMDYQTSTLQSDYSNQFKLVGMQHEFITGIEYLYENSHRTSLQNLGGTSALNPPVYDPYLESTTATPVNFVGNSYALYAQDTVEFIPHWKATVGLREDKLSADYASTTSPHLGYNALSKRAALSYQPTYAANYYIGYSDSFSPTADLYQLTVTPLPPETSQVVEAGAKWLFFDGDLSFRTAIYHAVKNWERNTDLEATAAILTRKRKTDGIEFETSGKLTDRWEVFAGLALMDSKILEVAENINATTGAITFGNAGYIGQRARNTPPWTFNLWSTYALGGGWKVGGGVEAKGERYGYNPSGAGAIPTLPGGTTFAPNTAPSYQRWDALVAYEQKTWAVRMNVRNVFDKVYYDSLYDNGAFTVPGTRRAFILTGELKF
jgi:catecholate siderophore receptor